MVLYFWQYKVFLIEMIYIGIISESFIAIYVVPSWSWNIEILEKDLKYDPGKKNHGKGLSTDLVKRLKGISDWNFCLCLKLSLIE